MCIPRPARILSRPWAADIELAEVISKMAFGRESPAQMVQRSTHLRDWFRDMLPDGTRARNLKAAKHRFESFQRPLGRSIRHFRVLHALMVRLATDRQDDSAGQRAKDWLTWVAQTPRLPMPAAMLADAADEGMAITRYCDNEGMDPASLSTQILSFLNRVNSLFGVAERCLHVVGYTRTMLEDLRQSLVWTHGGARLQPHRPVC